MSGGLVHLSEPLQLSGLRQRFQQSPRTWACNEIIVHRAHESLLIFVRRYDGRLPSRVEALLGLVFQCLGERVAADGVYQPTEYLALLFVYT